MSRTNRALDSHDWEEHYPDVIQQIYLVLFLTTVQFFWWRREWRGGRVLSGLKICG